MKTTRARAGAIGSLCLIAPAQAAPGWYLSLEGGGSLVSDWEHTRTKWTYCGPEVKEALAAFDTGYAAFGAAGYAIDAWRVEVEGGFRQNDIESYEKSSWGRSHVVDAAGELSEASVMVNIIYDVPLFERFSLRSDSVRVRIFRGSSSTRRGHRSTRRIGNSRIKALRASTMR